MTEVMIGSQLLMGQVDSRIGSGPVGSQFLQIGGSGTVFINIILRGNLSNYSGLGWITIFLLTIGRVRSSFSVGRVGLVQEKRPMCDSGLD